MNIFIGGVNGVGKTTLLQGVKILRPDWTFLKSSHAFMEWLGIPGDYAQLRQLNQQERDKKLEQFMEHILTAERLSHLLLDSHYLNMKYGSIESVTGLWLSRFDALVLITAPIEVIWERLNADIVLRDRALFSENTNSLQNIDILSEYIKKTEEEFYKCAKQFEKPHLRIENMDKATAAEQLITFVETL